MLAGAASVKPDDKATAKAVSALQVRPRLDTSRTLSSLSTPYPIPDRQGRVGPAGTPFAAPGRVLCVCVCAACVRACMCVYVCVCVCVCRPLTPRHATQSNLQALSTLTRVVKALRDEATAATATATAAAGGGAVGAPSASASAHIPFRDSALTRLLKRSLQGNCSLFVVNVVSGQSESLVHSLRFAAQLSTLHNYIWSSETAIPSATTQAPGSVAAIESKLRAFAKKAAEAAGVGAGAGGSDGGAEGERRTFLYKKRPALESDPSACASARTSVDTTCSTPPRAADTDTDTAADGDAVADTDAGLGVGAATEAMRSFHALLSTFHQGMSAMAALSSESDRRADTLGRMGITMCPQV